MTTLITFIGRTEANRGYRFTPYRFDNGTTIESKLFAAAALMWLQQTNRKPSRLIVIGTPSSGWDVLMELVERLAPHLADQALEWALPVSEALSSPARAAPEQSLRDFESRFSEALGLRIELVIAPNEGDGIFAALHDKLQANEQVALDVTHSFRSMPIHALVALGALRWLKGVELSDILYGSLDERDASGGAAARSLGETARLAKATPALAQLALADDVGGMADTFGSQELGNRLAETQRLESLMQFSKAAGPRGQAIGLLRRIDATDSGAGPIKRTVAKRVCDTLSALNAGSGSNGLRNRTERALARDDFMRAVGMANEMLLLKAIELRHFTGSYDQLNGLSRDEIYRQADLPGAPCTGRFTARDNFTTLNYLRNAVMHPDGGIADKGVPRVVNSADDMRSLLAWSLSFYDFLT
jgi:CRISPR-associated Csx2 family protein